MRAIQLAGGDAQGADNSRAGSSMADKLKAGLAVRVDAIYSGFSAIASRVAPHAG